MKTIYSLVVINEDMQICAVTSFSNKQDAVKELEEDYHRTIDMLKHEGWDKSDLEENELNLPYAYYIKYGDSSYYAEVKENELYDSGEE